MSPFVHKIVGKMLVVLWMVFFLLKFHCLILSICLSPTFSCLFICLLTTYIFSYPYILKNINMKMNSLCLGHCAKILSVKSWIKMFLYEKWTVIWLVSIPNLRMTSSFWITMYSICGMILLWRYTEVSGLEADTNWINSVRCYICDTAIMMTEKMLHVVAYNSS